MEESKIEYNESDLSKKTRQDFEKIKEYYHASNLRSNQLQMATDVAEYLENEYDGSLFLEAPVGTGKSLGVLIPSLNYCNNRRQNILYATATINLQLQLIDEEMQILTEIGTLTDEPLLALGRENYACSGVYSKNRGCFSKAKQKKLNKFFYSAKTGQRFEMEKFFGLSLSDEEWNLISMEGRCTENKCPGHNHRRKYKNKRNLTITNQAQLINSYLSLKDEQHSTLNIKPGIIIIDEAHLFQQNFMQMLDKSLFKNKLKYIKNTKVSDSTKNLFEYISFLEDKENEATSNFV